jgi:tetratricopeptide (TPR) repeat protein
LKFFSFYLNKIRLLLLLCIPVFSFASIEEAALEQANAYYRQGEAAKQRLLRQKAFNRALVQLKEIERQALPSQNQEKLDLALGNTYFQLEEYAWAILYYYRALNWNPNSQIARQGLEKAQLQLGLNPQTELPFLEQILSFDFWLPLPQRFALLFWSLILTFLALSLWIWIKRPLTKILALLFTIVSSFFPFNTGRGRSHRFHRTLPRT